MSLAQFLALAQALQPFFGPVTVTVKHILAALHGAGVLTEADADADLRALIAEALIAKAAADREAHG